MISLKREILKNLSEKISPDKRKLLYKALLEKKKILDARKNINAFAEYVFEFKQISIHRSWQKFADENPRAFIEAPQEHGKTTQMAVIRPLFKLGQNPERWFKIVTSNDDKGADILSECSTNIESNPRLHKVFPNLIPQERGTWTRHKLIVKRKITSKNPSLEAIGILSTGSGGRASDLVFDDPVDFRNSILQPALKTQIIKSYKDVWLGTLKKANSVIYICNAWASDDLTQEIKEPRYHFKKLSCKIDENFTPLWPEEWPRERLLNVYEERGEDTFNRAFRHRPVDEKEKAFTNKITPSLIKIDNDSDEEEINSLEDFRKKYISPDWPKFAGCDLAISSKKVSSYTVIFEIAVDRENNRWPTYIKRGKLTSPDTARLIRELYVRDRFYLMKVENNGYQEALLQWMDELEQLTSGRSALSVPVEGFVTGNQKFNLDIGIPSIAMQMSKGKWKIPKFHHGHICKCEICEWLRDLQGYPTAKRSYDLLMAMWLADRAAQTIRKEPSLRFIGEEDEDLSEEELEKEMEKEKELENDLGMEEAMDHF